MIIFKWLIPFFLFAALMSGCGYEELNTTKNQSLTIASDYLHEKDSVLFSDFAKKTNIKVNIVHLSLDSLSNKIIENPLNVDFDMVMISEIATLENLKNKDLLQRLDNDFQAPNVNGFFINTGADPIVFKSNRKLMNDTISYNDLSKKLWYPVLNEVDLKKLYNGNKKINQWTTNESALWLSQAAFKKLDYPLTDSLAPEIIVVGFLSQFERQKPFLDSLNTFKYTLFPDQLKLGLFYNFYGAGIVYQSRNFDAAMQLIKYFLMPNQAQLINDKIGIVSYDHQTKTGIYLNKKLTLNPTPFKSYSFNLKWWNAHINDAKNIKAEEEPPKKDSLTVIDSVSKEK